MIFAAKCDAKTDLHSHLGIYISLQNLEYTIMAEEVYFGVLNTDEVNLQNIKVPVGALVSGLERSVRDAIKNGLPVGLPSHIGHDMHRPTGWCITTGILLASDISRQLGSVYKIDQDERADLHELLNSYWRAYDADGTADFDAELREMAGEDTADAVPIRCEAAVIKKEGVAAKLYPDLFELGRPAVDKDGLTYYKDLLEATSEIQPGVFHDKKRNLLLFASRFFRRSLSHRNALNGYFLAQFSRIAREKPELRSRLRLDPDVVGHPASLMYILEFEHWSGPKFQNDISHIATGVTEQKADDDTRYYAGVDKMQFWWKSEETRAVDEEDKTYRTFEAEELCEDPSAGLSDAHFGCRYTHAEYTAETKSITHFDGAIRAYDADAYFERIECRIDRAGKRSTYTKLFRFDGQLDVGIWQSLTADYFRGNKLVSEYFGRDDAHSIKSAYSIARPAPSDEIYRLMVCISFSKGDIHNSDYVIRNELADTGLFWVEEPSEALFELLQPNLEARGCFLVYGDGNINFPIIGFGSDDMLQSANKSFQVVSEKLLKDFTAGKAKNASFTFEWVRHGIKNRLSLAGAAECVAELLASLPSIISPDIKAAAWVGQLKTRIGEIVSITPAPQATPLIRILRDGSLQIPHEREPQMRIHLAEAKRLNIAIPSVGDAVNPGAPIEIDEGK